MKRAVYNCNKFIDDILMDSLQPDIPIYDQKMNKALRYNDMIDFDPDWSLRSYPKGAIICYQDAIFNFPLKLGEYVLESMIINFNDPKAQAFVFITSFGNFRMRIIFDESWRCPAECTFTSDKLNDKTWFQQICEAPECEEFDKIMTKKEINFFRFHFIISLYNNKDNPFHVIELLRTIIYIQKKKPFLSELLKYRRYISKSIFFNGKRLSESLILKLLLQVKESAGY